MFIQSRFGYKIISTNTLVNERVKMILRVIAIRLHNIIFNHKTYNLNQTFDISYTGKIKDIKQYETFDWKSTRIVHHICLSSN